MALTFPRWIAAAVIGAAAVWLGLFHTVVARIAGAGRSPATFTNTDAASLAGAAMTRAADRLRLLQIRDSVLRQPATRGSGTPIVLISATYGDAISRELDSLIRERWNAAGVGGNSRTVIAAVLDSSTVVAGGLRPRLMNSTSVNAFLPDSSAGSPCVSILRVPVQIDSRASLSLRHDLLAPETIGALIGPCLYYAAFGAPGPRVAQWLQDGGWRLSHVTDWQAAAPTFAPSLALSQSRLLSDEEQAKSLLYQPRLWTTTSGLACLAGEPGRCIAALVPPRRQDADTMWRRRVVAATGANENLFRMPRARSTLGPSEGWLLSEMVRTLGRKQFAMFWRSREPVGEAFRVAANQSLDTWVHDWAVRMYGPLPTGPGLSRSTALAGAILLMVAAIVAATVVRGRRVA